MDSEQSVVVYDLETSGPTPSCDRIVQFAAVRATPNLSEIIESANFLVKLDPCVVPDPTALVIGQLTPQRLDAEGVPEAQAMETIRKFMGKSDTLRCGYNNIAFDDEFLRYGMWRNLLDPYDTEWTDGNCRMDVQTLCRAAGVLAPNIIPEWPTKEDGVRTYKLGLLMDAFGIEFDGRAHDALADSKGTLELLKRIRSDAPRIWDRAISYTNKYTISDKIAADDYSHVIMHIGPFYGNDRLCAAPLACIGEHPVMANRTIHVDLGGANPPDMLLDMTSDEIATNLFSKTEELKERSAVRPPVHLVAHNASPFIADLTESERKQPGALATFVERTRGEVGADPAEVERRKKFVDDHRSPLQEKMREVFADREREETDAELALYNGFVSNSDRILCRAFRTAVGAEDTHGMEAAISKFNDTRLRTLAARFAARSCRNPPASALEAYGNHVSDCVANGFASRPSMSEFREKLGQLPDDLHDASGVASELQEWCNPSRTALQHENQGLGR